MPNIVGRLSALLSFSSACLLFPFTFIYFSHHCLDLLWWHPISHPHKAVVYSVPVCFVTLFIGVNKIRKCVKVVSIPRIKCHATRKTAKIECKKSVEVFSSVLSERSWLLLKARMVHFFRRVWRRALVSFLMFVCLSACVSSAPTGRISMKSDIGDFYENPYKNPNLVKVRQKYRAFYTTT